MIEHRGLIIDRESIFLFPTASVLPLVYIVPIIKVSTRIGEPEGSYSNSYTDICTNISPCANTEPTVCLTVTMVAIGTPIRKATILAQRQIVINQLYPVRVLTTDIIFNI